MDSEDSDQSARMRRLILVVVGRTSEGTSSYIVAPMIIHVHGSRLVFMFIAKKKKK